MKRKHDKRVVVGICMDESLKLRLLAQVGKETVELRRRVSLSEIAQYALTEYLDYWENVSQTEDPVS